MKRKFLIYPSFDGSLYSLKREGETGVADFRSVREAIDYARSCPEGGESRIQLFDRTGIDSIEIPANLPRAKLSFLFMFFQNPGRN